MQPTRAEGKEKIFEKPTKQENAVAGAPDGYKKALFTLPLADIAWIDSELGRFQKNTRLRYTKSQLVQTALELMRKRGGLDNARKEIS